MIKTSVNAFLFTVLSLSAIAQAPKLNNIQEGSVWMPQKVKVDAKLNEWNNNFQAYNKSTDIFYTLANDENNLYLVIQSTDRMNTSKIMAGGIDLTINPSGKKKDNQKDAFLIGFPHINMGNLRSMMTSVRPQAATMVARPGANGQIPGMDSAAVANMRKQIISSMKEIKLAGFKDIQDSLISIYNEYGIKTAADLDDKGNMVIELALPLKLFNFDAAAGFAYNIKLNGLNLNAMFSGMAAGGSGAMRPAAPVNGGGGGFGGGGNFGGGMPGGMPGGMQSAISNLISPTDFWGKYTLAKKQ